MSENIFNNSLDVPPDFSSAISPASFGAKLNTSLYGASAWTQVNFGTSTLTTQTKQLLLLTQPNSGENSRLLVRPSSVGGTGGFRITACFATIFHNSGSAGVKLVVRNSATGKFLAFGYQIDFFDTATSPKWQFGRYDNPSTLNGNIVSPHPWMFYDLVWFRLVYDGTKFTGYMSEDGANFFQYSTTENLATFLTTFNQWGWCANSGSASFGTQVRLLDWVEEAI